ncbi:hypothetical protein FIBSPDRAFT_171779 [Athelia psychrophila]|uniref:Uncharacterized protein n=1 Tax=Athelia psychrophila TaxID=1759441 RepID=A0A166AUF3_9AGAM|nr:hypothetical protein FIBSPDRAFT_171779 [Fibularhizoctonia sp. CBS 109695]
MLPRIVCSMSRSTDIFINSAKVSSFTYYRIVIFCSSCISLYYLHQYCIIALFLQLMYHYIIILFVRLHIYHSTSSTIHIRTEPDSDVSFDFLMYHRRPYSSFEPF